MKMSKLQFKEFKDIKVSTKTFTATTNLDIDLLKLFDYLEIVEYTVVPKKRGRRKKVPYVDLNKDIKYGSFISVEFKDKLKGADLKKNKKKKWFRNSFTIIVMLDKKINFKICKNGTFQMTGCKNNKHAIECINQIWKRIKNNKDIYKFTNKDDKTLKSMLIPAMRNIDFNLGFTIDREKLAKYMSNQTEFYCLLETSFGYTGVNIKIPIKDTISNMKIFLIGEENDEFKVEQSTYSEYLKTISEKRRNNKINMKKYNTFLVFHSGKVIMSGSTSEFMKETYYDFIKTIDKSYDYIKETLDT